MNISILIILAIVVSIALGYKTKINTGFFAMAFAYLIGCFALNMSTKSVIATWPISTFFVIFAVSLFYNFAAENGTLEKLSMNLLYSCRRFPAMLPLVIYFAATLVAGLGAGYFTVLAFFAPITLLLCDKTGMNKLAGAVSVNYGALAGANFMSSASGIIFRGLMSDAGYTEEAFTFSTTIFATTFILPIVVISLIIFLTSKKKDGSQITLDIHKPEPFNPKQKQNLILIGVMVVIVLAFPILKSIVPDSATISFINSKLDIGLIAIVFSVIALLLNLADQKAVLAKVPWNTIVMICGVGMLIQVAIQADTINMLAGWVSSNIPVALLPLAFAVIGGCMSFFSSTLGVVCPSLFPIIPAIALSTGLNPMLLFTATIVGAQSTSISPFSSGGSLIMGSAQTEEERTYLFPALLFKGVPVCLGFAIVAVVLLSIFL